MIANDLLPTSLELGGNKVISSYEKLERVIPNSIRQESSGIADDIINQSNGNVDFLTKINMKSNMAKILNSMGSRLDKEMRYDPTDAAYRVYCKLSETNTSNAWLISNALMLKWSHKLILNEPLTEAQIEKEAREAEESPIWFTIKMIIMALIQVVPIIAFLGYQLYNNAHGLPYKGPFDFNDPNPIGNILRAILIVKTIFTIYWIFKFFWMKRKDVKSVKTTNPIVMPIIIG